MANHPICSQCGQIGRQKRVAPGSILIELILWCCFFVPGLIYSIWRLSAKQPTCRHCGAIASAVPINSPRGKQLLAQLYPPDPAPAAPQPKPTPPKPTAPPNQAPQAAAKHSDQTDPWTA